MLKTGVLLKTGVFYDSVEMYDPSSNTWILLENQLPYAARNLGFFVLFDVEKRGMVRSQNDSNSNKWIEL